jgi:hypothetical protein
VRAALGLELGPGPAVPGSTEPAEAAAAEAGASGSSLQQQTSTAQWPRGSSDHRAAGPWPRPARAVPPRYRRLPRPKTCSTCGAGLSAAVPRFRVCYGCHCARYCGPQCQAGHWARHRQSCEALGDVLRGMAGLGLGE